mgnify:CR=1 FL=1|jgi:hypothetical protein|tara:strand:+ start:239 stop:607 length:369 start_codon:yes stop_codon:yes gene_type:complete
MVKTTGKKPLLRGDSSPPEDDVQETPTPMDPEEQKNNELTALKDGYQHQINSIIDIVDEYGRESMDIMQETLDNLSELHHKSAMEASAFRVCMHNIENKRSGLMVLMQKLGELKKDETGKVD